jgi:cytochrome c oxidase assembly factor CtaG
MNPDWPALLAAWNWEPSVILGVLVLCGMYLVASGWLPGWGTNNQRLDWRKMGMFLGGMALILLALISPIDEWSDHYLFSAHMLQHMLFMLVVPPLLILGFPDWISQRAAQSPVIRPLGQFLTKPLVAFIIFNWAFIFWHIPIFYEAALADERLHVVEHISFLVAGVINWWPVFSTSRAFPPAASGVQIIFLFLEGIPSTVLTAIIVFSSEVLYPTYAAAPRVFGLSPMEDQQIAGLGMGSVGMVYYLAIMTYVFFRWLRNEENQAAVEAQTRG